MQIDVDDAIAQGAYSNLVLINHNDNEFILDFAYLQPAAPRARVRARIISSPRHTKRLLRALEHNVRRYEERFGPIEEPEPLSPGMFGYSWVREGQNGELMRSILDGARAFDIELEALHTETGPGVYEVAIRYDDCLRAADKAALFKTAMKQIAERVPAEKL